MTHSDKLVHGRRCVCVRATCVRAFRTRLRVETIGVIINQACVWAACTCCARARLPRCGVRRVCAFIFASVQMHVGHRAFGLVCGVCAFCHIWGVRRVSASLFWVVRRAASAERRTRAARLSRAPAGWYVKRETKWTPCAQCVIELHS